MSETKQIPSRRNIIGTTGTIALGAAIVALGGGATEANASTDLPASAEKKCGTCRYWGGVRRISENGETVTAEGKGWCNNPKSPAYQKQTKPTQGAPVWVKWGALG
jgi:hypothetical protein